MKRKKVCALLCVAALSTATITPAMAADNTADVQTATESTVVSEEQADVADASQEAQDPAGTEDVETPAQEEQSGVTEQTQDAAVSNEQTTESAPATDEVQNDADGEDEVQKDGWYEDEDGNYYYYEKGEMITEEIVEIEDEDGTYGYYFDSDGIMFRSGETYVSCLDENNLWQSGYIKADEDGHLYKGWNGDEYFGDDYFQYYNKTLKVGDDLYYFGSNGRLIRNQEVIIDNVVYKAEENGALTVVDTAGRNGWQLIGNSWYYYEDGKMLQSTFADIGGAQYYFWYDGTMATGRFMVDNFTYWAENTGQIVKAQGWYYSKQTKKWYWFDENGELVNDKILNLKGKKYYLNWDGEMETGVFYASYEDADGNRVNKRLYADENGVIDTSVGWKRINGDWYYVKADGTSASDEILEINRKKYKFSGDGKMETGKIYSWEDGEDTYYITDADGAIVTNNWVYDDMEWYHTDADGKILKNQWLGGTYYLTADGSMAIGETELDGKTYIFDENGYQEMILENQADGWHLADGNWYYVKDGKLNTGWINLEQKYYLENGKMLTNSIVPAEHLVGRYSYVDQNGHVKSGWAQGLNDWMYLEKDTETGDVVSVENGWKLINGAWYYFDDNFMIANAIWEIDGTLYRFTASGAWDQDNNIDKQGWKQVSTGDWYYVNENGTLNTDAIKVIDGKTYYFYESDGMLRKNTPHYDNKTGDKYWIDNNGNKDTSTGWKKASWGRWYYVENGKLVVGSKKIGGVDYYFYDGGEMADSTIAYVGEKCFLFDENGKKIDVSRDGWYKGKNRDGFLTWYYFKGGQPYNGPLGNYYIAYGTMVTGTYGTTHGLYLFDNNGIQQKNGWKLVNGIWYYAGSTGRLYTGERNIGGKKYWFNENGEWIR